MDRREFLRLSAVVGAAAAFNVVTAKGQTKTNGSPTEFSPGVRYWQTTRYLNTFNFTIADGREDRLGDVLDPAGMTVSPDAKIVDRRLDQSGDPVGSLVVPEGFVNHLAFAPMALRCGEYSSVKIIEHHLEATYQRHPLVACAMVRQAFLTRNRHEFCGAKPLTCILCRIDCCPKVNPEGVKEWVSEFLFDEYPTVAAAALASGFQKRHTDFARLLHHALGTENLPCPDSPN